MKQTDEQESTAWAHLRDAEDGVEQAGGGPAWGIDGAVQGHNRAVLAADGAVQLPRGHPWTVMPIRDNVHTRGL